MDNEKILFRDAPPCTRTFTLNGFGLREPMPAGITDRRNGTGDYLFMLFYDRVEVGSISQRTWTKPPTVALWSPGDGQYYGNKESAFCHSWVHCAGAFIGRILRAARLKPPLVLSVDAVTMMEDLLESLYGEAVDEPNCDAIIVRNHVENFVRQLARKLSQPERDTVPKRFRELRVYLERTVTEPHSLAGLAARVHLSVPHFCHEFRRYYSVAPIEYLLRMRMQQADYFLLDHNMSIAEVARRVGVDDPYYFSRLFKKHFGMSPRARRTARGGNDGRRATV